MYRVFIIVFLVPIFLLAYNDSDLDGVEDKVDQCANTPLTELVDLTGCTIKNLVSPHHFEILVGQSYAEENNISLNLSQFQLGYYYKAFSVLLSGAYYDLQGNDYSENGLNDLYLDAYYQIKPTDNIRVQFGAGVIFPTYDSSSNKTDYRVSIQSSYTVDDFSLFAGLGTTIVGDSSETTAFQSSHFYKAGIGYYLSDKLYTSLSYNHSTSIYDSLGDIQNFSYYAYYMIDKNWFTTFKYAHGLSDNALDKLVGLKLGYYW
jgi:hypothetical protein